MTTKKKKTPKKNKTVPKKNTKKITENAQQPAEFDDFSYLRDKSIVMVDDDPFLREMYERIFEQEKIEIHITDNGQKGLAMILKHNPDIVVMDVMMPIMSGIDLLTALQKEKVKPKIVMLSDMEQDGVIDRAMSLGAMGYVIKNQHIGRDLLRKIIEILTSGK